MDTLEPHSPEVELSREKLQRDLESVRSLLFAQEKERIRVLEVQAAALAQVDQEQAQQLQTRIQSLQQEIEVLEKA